MEGRTSKNISRQTQCIQLAYNQTKMTIVLKTYPTLLQLTVILTKILVQQVPSSNIDAAYQKIASFSGEEKEWLGSEFAHARCFTHLGSKLSSV